MQTAASQVSVVTAASQVSPFREHGIHYIQANIVYRVDVDRCDLFGTLLDLSSWAKPCICTAPGHAMFVPSVISVVFHLTRCPRLLRDLFPLTAFYASVASSSSSSSSSKPSSGAAFRPKAPSAGTLDAENPRYTRTKTTKVFTRKNIRSSNRSAPCFANNKGRHSCDSLRKLPGRRWLQNDFNTRYKQIVLSTCSYFLGAFVLLVPWFRGERIYLHVAFRRAWSRMSNRRGDRPCPNVACDLGHAACRPA